MCLTKKGKASERTADDKGKIFEHIDDFWLELTDTILAGLAKLAVKKQVEVRYTYFSRFQSSAKIRKNESQLPTSFPNSLVFKLPNKAKKSYICGPKRALNLQALSLNFQQKKVTYNYE